MAKNPEQLAHLEWLGYVQPVGLVVSVPALLAAQAQVNTNTIPLHQKLLACLPRDKHDEVIPEIPSLSGFTQTVLDWEPADLPPVPAGEPLPQELASLEVVLPEYHETLRPTHVVRDGNRILLLVQALRSGVDFDDSALEHERGWHASPQAKFERLLRESGVPIGLLFNATQLRLVYAPRGETSGYMTFSVAEMTQVAGRPIVAGLHLLLSAERLFSLPEKQRLPAILADSRKYQNTVSTQLAEQVLGALYELLRGFQAADDHRHGDLLREVLRDNPNHVYAGLLNVLMRLVFILYAEDRGLLPADPVYRNHYAVTGLFGRLREDDGHHPDTMDLRFGAWGQLLALFRMIHAGGRHGAMKIPAREGYLFDPDRYPFLEGRQTRSRPSENAADFDVPRVPDGVVFRALSNLLILDGERLSYRTLDVEQVGSVYEAIMGFNLEVARGRSIAIKAVKPHGAPATIDLDALLACKGKDRPKWLRDASDQTLTGEALEKLQSAESIESIGGLLEALDRKIAKAVTPNVVPKGAMVLQPSDERRRSGSHYTPRSLTEPIVKTTLRPILERLGGKPTPEQILDLKVCDPAMGSGAFLVEVCRQLGDELVRAWHVHDRLPPIPPDEDEVLHARRLIAQRCLYGVDRNPMAVDLAKLSLWLATLAKDHPFTFLDHSLRCGDSLVGLTRDQIVRFHWKPAAQRGLSEDLIRKRVERATEYRRKILENAESTPYLLLQQHLALAEEALAVPRLIGDAAVSSFFSSDTDRAREKRRDELFAQVSAWMSAGLNPDLEEPLTAGVASLRSADRPIAPFHWEIEFPEVMARENVGFDAIVGNPPFAGKNTLINGNREGYLDWLKTIHEESHGNADLVAHFFRRAFGIVQHGGAFGLIATNTIGQGDTRTAGLRWICTHRGTIYNARRRYKWPGLAAVVVSVVHVVRGEYAGAKQLDGAIVGNITAFLFHRGGHENPERLQANAGKSFIGSYVLGMGFTFDDTDTKGVANSLTDMHRLIAENPRNQEVIFPYISGEEVSTSPTHAHHRYVINFGERSEEECRRRWPGLLSIIERSVRGTRAQHSTAPWWQFERLRPELHAAIERLDRVLVNPLYGAHLSFVFLPPLQVFANKLNVLPFQSYSAFACLQNRVHELWARMFSSTLKDDLAYAPSDCFETFPFPKDFESNPQLEAVGRNYYEFRSQLMVKNDEGLTKTYNRFHDPNEASPEIARLRELHSAMDRAVLDAYGWTDLQPTCEYLLDYEDDEADPPQGRQRKKPWRYRWPDDFRDEVLARLLELNKQRAEEERLAGPAGRGRKANPRKKRAKRSGENEQPTLSGI
ncbi:MAG TPA: DNA methyltransferase [Terriglobia bacterium]|nr:DNA methyltransferase [Terriglobia bacterium]